MNSSSLIDHLKKLKSAGSEKLAEAVSSLSDSEVEQIVYDWHGLWARPCTDNGDGTFGGQLPPNVPWDVWLILAGRGYGKTRTGAEWVRAEAAKQPVRFAFVAQDPSDARAVMIQGDSGIMEITPEHERPTFNPSTKLLNWPNGSIAEIHSAYDYESLRGPQFHRAWVDELCAFKYGKKVWDNLSFGMRLVAPDGSQPKTVVTTTPKPQTLLKEIMNDSGTIITTGSTYENIDNLSSNFIKLVIRRYENTSLGAQELHARILDEADGALWTREILELTRVESYPNLVRIVVAIDPMARASENARRRVAPPETGIIVAGLGEDDHAYVLADYSITNAKPDEWATKAIEAFNEHCADRIVAEVNNGGDMVEDVIKTREPNISFKKVHASRGKRVRAEPIAALYEQGKVHHTSVFPNLESQLCAWTGSDGEPSPDRLDALVWALTELMVGSTFSLDISYDASLGRGRSKWRDV